MKNKSISSASRVKTFSADLDQLTEIQKTFFDLRNKFIYFRKGEAANNIAIAAEWALLVAAVHAILELIKDYPKIRAGTILLKDDLLNIYRLIAAQFQQKPSLQLPVFREIACPDEDDITVSLELVNHFAGEVRYLPKERRGKFRYFVNDEKYCLFVRRNDGRFNGVIGDDPNMIATLKEAFEAEWDDLTPMQKALERNIPGLAVAKRLCGELVKKFRSLQRRP
jgi:hypothetical protein